MSAKYMTATLIWHDPFLLSFMRGADTFTESLVHDAPTG